MGGWEDRLGELALEVHRASTPNEFYDAERAVATDARQRSDELVAAILKFRATEPATVQPAKEAAQAKAKAADVVVKSHGERATRVRLLGGTEIRFETLALLPVAKKRPGRKRGVGRRGKGGAGVYPVLDMLGITGKATPALLAEVAREMTESTSYEVALASLRERGMDISKQVAMRLTYVMAARALEFRDARIEEATRNDLPESGELAGKRVFVSVDGGRTRIRHNPKAGRRNAKTRHRRYKAPWKEPRCYVAVPKSPICHPVALNVSKGLVVSGNPPRIVAHNQQPPEAGHMISGGYETPYRDAGAWDRLPEPDTADACPVPG